MGPALPHVENIPLALVDHPSNDGVTIKMPYEVHVLNHTFFLLDCLKLNLALFLNQLKLA